MAKEATKGQLFLGVIVLVGIFMTVLGYFYGDDVKYWWAERNRTPEERKAATEQFVSQQTQYWERRCLAKTSRLEAEKHLKSMRACVLAVGFISANCKQYDVVQDQVSCVVDLGRLNLAKKKTGCVLLNYDLKTGNFDWDEPHENFVTEERRRQKERMDSTLISQCSIQGVKDLFAHPRRHTGPLPDFYDKSSISKYAPHRHRKAVVLFSDIPAYETIWLEGINETNGYTFDEWEAIIFDPFASE